MLELLRGKRLVFVGDSLNRNMWESLICILRNSVKNQNKVYEEFGRQHFRTEASYSFVFEVEFLSSPCCPKLSILQFASCKRCELFVYRTTNAQWSSL